MRRNVQVFLAAASEPKNIILTRAREVVPPEGVAGRQERDARGGAPDAFGGSQRSGTAGKARIGVIFLGQPSSDNCAGGKESEQRFHASFGMTVFSSVEMTMFS